MNNDNSMIIYFKVNKYTYPFSSSDASFGNCLLIPSFLMKSKICTQINYLEL